MKVRLMIAFAGFAAAFAIMSAFIGVGLPRFVAGLGQGSGPAVFAEGIGGAPAPAGKSLRVVLDKVEKHPEHWLFHFTIRNTLSSSFTILGDGQVNQFIFYGVPDAQRLGSVSQLSILVPPQASYVIGHPALPRGVEGSASSNGWLEADFSPATYPAYEIQYRYATFHTEACKNPADPSTCHPTDLYHVVVWAIPGSASPQQRD